MDPFTIAMIASTAASGAGLLANSDSKKLPSFGDFETEEQRQLRSGTFEDIMSRLGSFRPYTGSLTPSTPEAISTAQGKIFERLGSGGAPNVGRTSLGLSGESNLMNRLANPFDANQVIDAPGAQDLFNLRRSSLREGFDDTNNKFMEQLVGLGLDRSPAGLSIVSDNYRNQALQEQLLAQEIANEQLNRFAQALNLQETSRAGDISKALETEGGQRTFDLAQFTTGSDIQYRDIAQALGLGEYQTGVEERSIDRVYTDFLRQFDEQRANLEDALALLGNFDQRQQADYESRFAQVSDNEARRKEREKQFGGAFGSGLDQLATIFF